MRKSREDGVHSQNYIIEALSQLLKDSAFEDITVTDICKKAGVARVTFYKYYQSINSVMHAAVNIRIEEFLAHITNLNPDSDLKVMIEYAVEQIYPIRGLLKKLIDSNMSGILLDFFNYALEKINRSNTAQKKPLTKIQSLFLAGGTFNIILDWIKTESPESPQALVSTVYEMLSLAHIMEWNNPFTTESSPS